MGNTVVVVEHDAGTMLAADHLVDMGPGAGVHGGYVVAQGSPQEIIQNKDSLTGKYLQGLHQVILSSCMRQPKGFLTIEKASKHNLKMLTTKVPLGLFTCVTGVSGSGKSTLVLEVLFHSLSQLLYQKKPQIDGCKSTKGADALDKVIAVSYTHLTLPTKA